MEWIFIWFWLYMWYGSWWIDFFLKHWEGASLDPTYRNYVWTLLADLLFGAGVLHGWYFICFDLIFYPCIILTPSFIPIRRAANPPKVLYLRSLMHPPPTHLFCNDHLIAKFLSFHMSLVVVIYCGAGNALRGFEISLFYFFLKFYFIHISKDILPLWALNAIK